MRHAKAIVRPSTRFFALLVCVAIIAAVGNVARGQCSDHGVAIGGYPSWQERAQLTLINACRISPTEYRDLFMPGAGAILLPANYPPVAPLEYAVGVNLSARAHCRDMADNDCLQHNDCDGSRTWAERVGSYNPGWGLLGENIAGGFVDPLTCVGGLIADAVDGAPAPDAPGGGGFDGHRWNIMYANYTHLGCGFVEQPESDYVRYYTQDFLRPLSVPAPCSPIASGSHVYAFGQVLFLCTWYSEASPLAAAVVIDGASHPLGVLMGTGAKGTHAYWSSAVPDRGCWHYHFEFTDATETAHRYPVRGELRTVGGPSGCQECPADFDGDGVVAMADIFDFLNRWLAGDLRTDADASGDLGEEDIFAFVNLWSAGC